MLSNRSRRNEKQMKHNWLSGMKLRTFRKHKRRINIDGVGYSLERYTELFKLHSQVRIGDIIFNPYRSIWEPVKEIKKEIYHLSDYTESFRHQHVTFRKIFFITETDYLVYDLNEYKDYFMNNSKISSPPHNSGKCWY